MERLTVNDLNKVCYDPWELCGMDRYCTKGCHEDGGCTKGCKILKMYRKLAEYEDLEEQGLLKIFSCKVGDIVYFPDENFNYIFPVTICKIIISDLGEEKYCIQYNGCFFNGYGDPEKDFEFDEDDFGKTVFLTQAEAEKALKNMEWNYDMESCPLDTKVCLLSADNSLFHPQMEYVGTITFNGRFKTRGKCFKGDPDYFYRSAIVAWKEFKE